MCSPIRQLVSSSICLQATGSGSLLHLHDKREVDHAREIVAVTTQSRHMARSENPQGVRKGGSSRRVSAQGWKENKSEGNVVCFFFFFNALELSDAYQGCFCVCQQPHPTTTTTTTTSHLLYWYALANSCPGIYDQGWCILQKNKKTK